MKQMVVEESPTTRKRKGEDDANRQDMVAAWKAKNNKRANKKHYE
jgi:hypothetical protein